MSKQTNKKRSIFPRLSRYVLEQWPLFLLALALTLGSNQLSLLGPKYSGAAIDAIELEGGVDFPAVWENVIRMLGCYLISAMLAYLLSVVMIRLSQRIMRLWGNTASIAMPVILLVNSYIFRLPVAMLIASS